MSKLTPVVFTAKAANLLKEVNSAALDYHHEDWLVRNAFLNASLENTNIAKIYFLSQVKELEDYCSKIRKLHGHA